MKHNKKSSKKTKKLLNVKKNYGKYKLKGWNKKEDRLDLDNFFSI